VRTDSRVRAPYACGMDFAHSTRGTLGVEWELQLVDRSARDLAPVAPAVLARVDDDRVKGEFLQNTVELVTGVHATTDAAIAEVRELRDLVVEAADAEGADVIGSGTHPTARWRGQPVSDSPRYRRLIEHGGSWAERLLIFGVHTHVGIDRPRQQTIPVLHALLDHLPLILALSASSPYWQGHDSGYASQRAMLFQQIPNAGLPPEMPDWDTWERVAHDLVHVGAADGLTELRWDVRPSPRLGTVEARIADGAPSLAHVHAITALTHCLVEERMRALDAGTEPERIPSWLVRENRWRTARFGLDAVMVTNAEGATMRVAEVLHSTLDRLAPIAEDLGATAGIDAAVEVLARGGSTAQQREAMIAGGMDAVLQHLVDAMRD
jgi:carboxylate-amine ligase